MSVPFQALGDNVLIRPFLRTQTKGGIQLPEQVAEGADLLQGEVISIGPGAWQFGSYVETTLKAGDTVFLSFRGRPSNVIIDGEKYVICREEEITGVAIPVINPELN